MPLPIIERVLYQISPLDQVICQLRFPTVLRIDAYSPVGFQEIIRTQYPFYETRSAIKLPAGIPAEIAHAFAMELPGVATKNHEFASKDRDWVLNINSQFIALTSRSYSNWEGFRSRMEEAAAALATEYAPAFYTRVGLRYRNIVRRSRLPARSQPWEWSELIQPWLTGLLSRPETASHVEDARCATVLAFGDSGVRCILNHGLAIDDAKEQVFLIDADCYTEETTEPGNALNRLDSLHQLAHQLFRWCITDSLHAALGPQPVE